MCEHAFCPIREVEQRVEDEVTSLVVVPQGIALPLAITEADVVCCTLLVTVAGFHDEAERHTCEQVTQVYEEARMVRFEYESHGGLLLLKFEAFEGVLALDLEALRQVLAEHYLPSRVGRSRPTEQGVERVLIGVSDVGTCPCTSWYGARCLRQFLEAGQDAHLFLLAGWFSRCIHFDPFLGGEGCPFDVHGHVVAVVLAGLEYILFAGVLEFDPHDMGRLG